MLKSALYARTSTQRQENEETIKSQVDEIEKKIREDGNILLPQHVYKDDGWSGTILERPALDMLLEAVKNHEFDVVYIYDRGRLARKFVYQEIILEEIQKHEVQIVFLHGTIAVEPEEVILQQVEGIFHEYERVKIAERFRRGKMFKVKNGELLGYNPLYGYNYIPKTRDRNGYFEINEEEAEVVRMIFDWVANKGFSLNMVIKELYKRKIKPQKGKRECWSNSPINRMIKNTSYYGDHYYNKCTGAIPKNPKSFVGKYKKVKKSSKKAKPKDEWILHKIPPIISKELFERAQKRIELNSKYALRNKKYEYLLSGKVQCVCGKKRCGESIKKDGKLNQYYRCAERQYNPALPRTCHERGVNANVLDKIVYEKLVNFLGNSDLIEKQAKKWFSQKEEVVNYSGKNEINKLELQLNKLKEEESRYVHLYGIGEINMEIYKESIESVNSRRDIILNELKEKKKDFDMTSSFPNWDIQTVCKIADRFIKTIDFNVKSNAVMAFVQKVVANQQRAVICGCIPLEFATEKVVLHATDWYCGIA